MAKSAKSRGQSSGPGTEAAATAETPRLDPVPAEIRAEVPPSSPAAVPTPEPVEVEPPAPDPVRAEPPPPPPPPEPPAPQVQTVREVTVQRVGFLPVVAGGIVAGAIGFAAAWLQRPAEDGTAEALAALGARVDAVAARIDALPAPPDVAPAEAAAAAAQAGVDELSGMLAILETRLAEVERAPSADGTLAETAIAAWEAELDGVRAEIAAQQARLQEIAASAEAQLTETRAQAEAIEADAEAAAQRAVARAALARIVAAIETGGPYAAALDELGGALGEPLPAALSDPAAEGVPALALLRDDFPAAARAALAAARREGLDDEAGGGVMAFLRSRYNVRSVTPREGASPDAILSRAEAALADNRLADALAEVESLPEVVRAEMTGWLALATTRAEALAAAEVLGQSLNAN